MCAELHVTRRPSIAGRSSSLFPRSTTATRMAPSGSRLLLGRRPFTSGRPAPNSGLILCGSPAVSSNCTSSESPDPSSQMLSSQSTCLTQHLQVPTRPTSSSFSSETVCPPCKISHCKPLNFSLSGMRELLCSSVMVSSKQSQIDIPTCTVSTFSVTTHFRLEVLMVGFSFKCPRIMSPFDEAPCSKYSGSSPIRSGIMIIP
mmetsp:Transcript_55241/g.151964  ORF Transcript_55241/g.151964 Transcript_55241/m.151964 type:complete len:202 (-) Transcript_55241:1473-2078(-)